MKKNSIPELATKAFWELVDKGITHVYVADMVNSITGGIDSKPLRDTVTREISTRARIVRKRIRKHRPNQLNNTVPVRGKDQSIVAFVLVDSKETATDAEHYYGKQKTSFGKEYYKVLNESVAANLLPESEKAAEVNRVKEQMKLFGNPKSGNDS